MNEENKEQCENSEVEQGAPVGEENTEPVVGEEVVGGGEGIVDTTNGDAN